MITVIDVFRERGIEPESSKTWAVGQMVVQRYKRDFGELPPKDLGRKTCGVGVHCFAQYPEEYRPVISEMIDRVTSELARQIDWVGFEQ